MKAPKRGGGRWVLMDTSAIVGVFMQDDQWHAAAIEAMEELQDSRRRLLTTSDVFNETVTALRRWAGHKPAVEAGEILRKSTLVTIVSLDDEIRDKAWGLFKKYSDQHLSYTDCTSFATMNKFRIREAFSFDDDFQKVGYLTIP